MLSPLLIPSDLIRDHLLPFLDLIDCTRLDSAVLCTSLRHNWLDGLAFAILQDRHSTVESGGLSWVKKKRVRFGEVELSGDVSDADVVECDKEVLSELRTLRISSCQSISDEGLTHIVQNCTKLHALEIDYCHRILRLELNDVRPYALKELNFIECCELDDAAFIGLVVHFSNLEVVNIAGCKKLTDRSVRALSSSCTKLREIQFCIENGITSASVSDLAQNCTKLQKIVDMYVFRSRYTSHADPTGRYNGILVELAQKCPLLEHVEIHAPALTNEQLVTFSQHCPNLHTFNIGMNDLVLEDGIEKLLGNCPLLRSINLVCLHYFSDLEAIQIVKHCRALKALRLTEGMNFSKSLLYDLWSANTGLETLVLELDSPENASAIFLDVPSFTTALTNLNISETNIAHESLLILFARCPLLSTLNMGESNSASSADVMTCLGKFCPLLHTLNLAQCDSRDGYLHTHYCQCESGALFLPPDLTSLAVHCTSLTSLSLFGSNATEEGLSAIIARNTKLQYLDLRSCHHLTDGVMHTLTKSCANLRTLLLKKPNISDTTLFQLVQNCRALRKMSLVVCPFVKMQSLILLAQHNRRLEHLCVTSSKHLRDTIFHVLRQHCPYLRQVELYDC